MNLGQLVRILRTNRHLTLDEFGELAGMSRSAVSRIELGQQGITVEQVDALCRALGMSVTRLFTRLEADQAAKKRRR